MTKNRILFWIFALLASVAVALGLCLLFLGTKDVSILPDYVEIESVDGKYYLSTQYNAEYNYQFKLEQQIDGKFVLIDTVESDKNSILLEDFSVDIHAGQIYRFSARYTAENGAGNTAFCGNYIWRADFVLNEVKNVRFDSQTNILSWDDSGADFYSILLLKGNGDAVEYNQITTCAFDLGDVEVGAYRAFVSACSSNPFVSSSTPSGNVAVEISRKNVLKSAIYDECLIVTCTEKVENFCIMLGAQQVAIIEAGQPVLGKDGYVYTLTNAQICIQEGVQIKSLETRYVFESELVEIE